MGSYLIGSLLFGLLKWGVESLFVLGVALSATVWAVEQLGAAPSLRRGWALSKGSWIRILAAEFLRDTLSWILLGSLTLIFVGAPTCPWGSRSWNIHIISFDINFSWSLRRLCQP